MIEDSLKKNESLIFACRFGSHLYGTETENSDMDYKAIYLPKIEDIIMGRMKDSITTSSGNNNSRNNNTDVDVETFSVMKYLKLLTQGQTVSMDMFFAPDNMILRKTKEWDIIQENKQYLICKNVTPFVGYCYQQAKKYGLKGSRVSAIKEFLNFLNSYNENKILAEIWDDIYKLSENTEYLSIESRSSKNGVEVFVNCAGKLYQKNLKISNAIKFAEKSYEEYGKRALMAEKNEGVDWKSLHHALRVCYQAIELLQTGNITYPLKERKFLTDIKKGLYHYNDCANMILENIEIIKELEKYSNVLPETFDENKVEEIILGFYL